MGELTHFDKEGNAVMVDVSQKAETERTATAKGIIRVSREVFEKIQAGTMAKGDVLGIARTLIRSGYKPRKTILFAALAAEGRTRILDSKCVDVSYPAFYDTFEELL